MLPDRVSNAGPLTYESGALPIALRGPAPCSLTRWPPELKIEKSLNVNSSYTPGPISFKLHRNVA